MAAVVAFQAVDAAVPSQADGAGAAHHGLAAFFAGDHRAPAAPVQQHDGLLALGFDRSQAFDQGPGQVHGAFLLAALLAHVDHHRGWQYAALGALFEGDDGVAFFAAVMDRFEAGRGAAEDHRDADFLAIDDGQVAGVVAR